MKSWAVAGAMAVGLLALGGCGGGRGHGGTAAGDAAAAGERAAAEVWTCSMHPEVRRAQAGKCPLCGMNLIPVAAGDAGASAGDAGAGDGSVRLSAEAIALAEIQTSPVRRGAATVSLSLYGSVGIDERRTGVQAVHVAGRLERLRPKVVGEEVRRGQVIASLYSPDVMLAEAELLEALRLPDSLSRSAAVRAARSKLQNWRIPKAQVQAIERTGKLPQRVDIVADRSGTITAFRATEGDYVAAGAPLYELTDLSALWAIFDAYESDLAQLRLGDTIAWTLPALPGESGKGVIDFISPDVDATTRTARVRVALPNPSRRLRPGMLLEGAARLPFRPPFRPAPATAVATADKSPTPPATARGEQADVLLIPRTAILWTGRRSVVYVQQSPGLFTMREITIGALTGNDYIVLSGLTEGEQVVTAGVFTVDAAAQLSGRHSMME